MIGAIQCPCHDGRFDPSTGAVISGPPPAPLPPIPVTVEGDQIFLTEA
jgi:Rieske Fe-S protein